jgi:hypothetical protein
MKRLLKKLATSQVKSFIQNIHQFRDASIKDDKKQSIKSNDFDEAQRA